MAAERTIEDVLRDIKDGLLCYGVALFYGQQEPGLDDTGASDQERKLVIYGTPAGFLGGLRIAVQGTRQELMNFDLFDADAWQMWPNPPQRDDREESPYVPRSGMFFWGGNTAHEWRHKVSHRGPVA